MFFEHVTLSKADLKPKDSKQPDFPHITDFTSTKIFSYCGERGPG